MGLLDFFGLSTRRFDALNPSQLAIASPDPQGSLVESLWVEIFGENVDLPMSRLEAMRIPAVIKGRNLLTAALAPQPLVALKEGVPVAKQPGWLQRTDGDVSPFTRMLWTIDDLIFYGWSVWLVTRGSDSYILTADRLDPTRWQINGKGEWLVDGQPIDETRILAIPGPHEGILTLASRVLRMSRDMELAVAARVRNPAASLEIKETQAVLSGAAQKTPEEIKALIADFAKARRSIDGNITFTPYGYDQIDHGATGLELFIDGRNQSRVDVGGYLGIESSLMDASLQSQSITYQNIPGTRSLFTDFTIPLWSEAIAGRLSQDDVVPSGQSVRFDLTNLVGPSVLPLDTPVED